MIDDIIKSKLNQLIPDSGIVRKRKWSIIKFRYQQEKYLRKLYRMGIK